MNKRTLFTFCAAIAITTTSLSAGATAASPSAARPQDGPLAVDLQVGKSVISKGQVDLFMESLTSGSEEAKNMPGDVEAKRTAARKELVIQEALAQQARAENLDEDMEVKDALEYTQRELLARVYIQNYFNENPITDEVLKTGYEWNRANGKIMEYKVRQILVPTRDEAEALIQRLKKGEDFIELTKLSKDPGGNTSGGFVTKTGWFRTDVFVDVNFTDAVESLKPGTYTKEPVRSRFGWHVIRLDEAPRAVKNAEPFEQLHESSREALRQKMAQKKLNELVSNAVNKIKLTDAKGKPVGRDELGLKP